MKNYFKFGVIFFALCFFYGNALAKYKIFNDSYQKNIEWYSSPNRTRLFFAPTGRMLREGESTFSDYYLFFPAFGYGINDHFSLGGGMSLFPGANVDRQFYYFTPKWGIAADDNSAFAVGAIMLTQTSLSSIPGIVYGVGTFGSPDRSLTAALGYGFYGNNLTANPLLVIGGEYRTSASMSLVTENWIFSDWKNPLISYGLRFFSETISVDLALLNSIGSSASSIGFPYIDFVVKL